MTTLIEPGLVFRVDADYWVNSTIIILEGVCTDCPFPFKSMFYVDMAKRTSPQNDLRGTQRLIVMERLTKGWLLYLVPSGVIVECSSATETRLDENG